MIENIYYSDIPNYVPLKYVKTLMENKKQSRLAVFYVHVSDEMPTHKRSEFMRAVADNTTSVFNRHNVDVIYIPTNGPSNFEIVL